VTALHVCDLLTVPVCGSVRRPAGQVALLGHAGHSYLPLFIEKIRIYHFFILSLVHFFDFVICSFRHFVIFFICSFVIP